MRRHGIAAEPQHRGRSIDPLDVLQAAGVNAPEPKKTPRVVHLPDALRELCSHPVEALT